MAVEVDRPDLLGTPVAEPETAVMPPRRFANDQVADQSLDFSHNAKLTVLKRDVFARASLANAGYPRGYCSLVDQLGLQTRNCYSSRTHENPPQDRAGSRAPAREPGHGAAPGRFGSHQDGQISGRSETDRRTGACPVHVRPAAPGST